MGEEGNQTPEMEQNKQPHELSPQEDGTKIPLTNEQQPMVDEAKCIPNEKDAKIDVGTTPLFSGLSKEELMKYSDDPFWVRMRMFLFILFWVTWFVMLIMAVVIIVMAPACKPPPEILWIEEEAMIEVDMRDIPADLKETMESLGIASAYFPHLMNAEDFSEFSTETGAFSNFENITRDLKYVVTDFPVSMSVANPLFNESFTKQYVDSFGMWNFEKEDLASVVVNMFLDSWITKGVKGFLMESSDDEYKEQFKDTLNGLLKEKGAAVGSNIVEFENEKKDFTPDRFRSFLEGLVGNWSFFKYDPVKTFIRMNDDDLRLVTIGLYMFSGTPILTHYKGINNSTVELMKHLSKMRSLDGIKIGATYFANTTRNVVAFTRVYKGTPAFAVALNFNNANETVSLSGTPNIGEVGTLEINSEMEKFQYQAKEKYDLANFILHPFQGVVIQFVANFS